MPSILIEVRKIYSESEAESIINAVHDAMCLAFKIPEYDKNIRLVMHEPHLFVCSPKLTQPEKYTYISIDVFSGRSIDAKRALYRAIVENLVTVGIPADHILILLREAPMENWGIRGGQAGCDVDFGFNIKV